jgi:hypothetical protein
MAEGHPGGRPAHLNSSRAIIAVAVVPLSTVVIARIVAANSFVVVVVVVAATGSIRIINHGTTRHVEYRLVLIEEGQRSASGRAEAQRLEG